MMTFRPARFFSAASATCLRSATEKLGNSPEVPSTTTPSAPQCLNQARTSFIAPGSNRPALSQGVTAAVQKSVLLLLPRLGAACAAVPLAATAAAAAPANPRASLRVASMGCLPAILVVLP